jgi:hypothetical protein
MREVMYLATFASLAYIEKASCASSLTVGFATSRAVSHTCSGLDVIS